MPSELSANPMHNGAPEILLREGRFSLIHHTGAAAIDRDDHWDLFLETGVSLWTIQISTLPQNAGKYCWTRSSDHRLVYLDFEGKIAGNRGTVVRIATGFYRSHESNSQWMIELVSPHLSAGWTVKLHAGLLPSIGTQFDCDVKYWNETNRDQDPGK